jgi:hypothetical protein
MIAAIEAEAEAVMIGVMTVAATIAVVHHVEATGRDPSTTEI